MFVHTELRNAKLQPGRPPDFSLRPRARSLPRLQNPVCIQTLTLSPQPRAIPSSFLFNRFQTLFSSRRTTVLNNPFGIKWFRTLSRYNGVYPLRSIFLLCLFCHLPYFSLSPHTLCALSPKSVWELLCSQHVAHSFLKQPGVKVFATKFLELKLL